MTPEIAAALERLGRAQLAMPFSCGAQYDADLALVAAHVEKLEALPSPAQAEAAGMKWMARSEAAEAREAALRKERDTYWEYTSHRPSCASFPASDDPCTCGYDALLTPTKEPA